jgi:hypothetical protein
MHASIFFIMFILKVGTRRCRDLPSFLEEKDFFVGKIS